MKKILINVAIFSLLVAPGFSLAAGLVNCNNNTAPVTNSDGSVTAPVACDFTQLMDLINNVIRFILVDLAVPIAAIMFFYAGVKMVTSGGSAESRSSAKKIFTNTALGLIFIAGSWLIIRTILSILGYEGAWLGF
ncbi:hypothetical protein HYZ82_02285 [Candidatus Nomurabacteria bacterium]|nr:hypothetical protein [Candidatus Nomurabacteria bacterium]